MQKRKCPGPVQSKDSVLGKTRRRNPVDRDDRRVPVKRGQQAEVTQGHGRTDGCGQCFGLRLQDRRYPGRLRRQGGGNTCCEYRCSTRAFYNQIGRLMQRKRVSAVSLYEIERPSRQARRQPRRLPLAILPDEGRVALRAAPQERMQGRALLPRHEHQRKAGGGRDRLRQCDRNRAQVTCKGIALRLAPGPTPVSVPADGLG